MINLWLGSLPLLKLMWHFLLSQYGSKGLVGSSYHPRGCKQWVTLDLSSFLCPFILLSCDNIVRKYPAGATRHCLHQYPLANTISLSLISHFFFFLVFCNASIKQHWVSLYNLSLFQTYKHWKTNTLAFIHNQLLLPPLFEEFCFAVLSKAKAHLAEGLY